MRSEDVAESANLLRPLLLELAGRLREPPALLIASGLLIEQADEFAAAEQKRLAEEKAAEEKRIRYVEHRKIGPQTDCQAGDRRQSEPGIAAQSPQFVKDGAKCRIHFKTPDKALATLCNRTASD